MPKHHQKAYMTRRSAASRHVDLHRKPRRMATTPLGAAVSRSRAVLRPVPVQAQVNSTPIEAQAQTSAGPDAPAFDEATLMRLVEDMRRAKGIFKRKRSIREKAALAATVVFELRFAIVIGLALYFYTNPELYVAIVAYVTDITGLPVTNLAQN